MTTAGWLTASGGLIFVALGVLHLIYAFEDLRSPRRFAPADGELLDRMKATRVRMRKDARNFWLSYLGFNFSHSVGAIFFGAAAIYAAASGAVLPHRELVQGALVLVALSYAIMAHRFWFIIPLIGAGLAAGFFGAGFLLVLSAPGP